MITSIKSTRINHWKKRHQPIPEGVSETCHSLARHAMCTLEKHCSLFVLTLNGSDIQHRLGLTLISSIRKALSQAKSQATRGSALVTVAEGKFFSNGLDLSWCQAAGSQEEVTRRYYQIGGLYTSLIKDLVSLPMPTIAAVTGHAAAAEFLLALSHDYMFMIGDRAVIYMPEVDLGLYIPDFFAAMIRWKIGSASVRRNLILAGRKMKGEEAAKVGIVETAHEDAESTLQAAIEMGEKLAVRKWNGEVYAEMRKSLYPQVLGLEMKAFLNPKL